MALGFYKKKVDLNPELEALRNKGLKENAVESNKWILRMIRRTSRIHAAFLFEDRKTLQNLCLFMSETQNKITDAGWEAFGYRLGLSPSVLKVINHNNFNKEDPCYNVLLAYVQYDNASIGKIIKALHSMGRTDILCRIQHSINDLADILQCNDNVNVNNVNNDPFNSYEETSDYESLTSCEGNNGSNSSSNSSIDSTCDLLIKPKMIPSAPFIFQNIQATPDLTSQQIKQAVNRAVLNSFNNMKGEDCRNSQNINKKITCTDNFIENQKINLTVENLQNQSITNYEKKNFTTPMLKYGLKILLTFAEDGEKYATEVCKIFRKKRDNYPRIGVLVLSEHADIVNKDPQQFICGAFSQVDYVCLILTSGYFNLISKKQKNLSLSNLHIDAFYATYIFRLMNSYFILNDCLNDKIRSIIPENEFSSIPLRSLWTNPIFGAWVKLNEVDDLAIRLLRYEKKTV